MFHFLFSASILLASEVTGADATLLSRYIIPSDDKTYGGLSAIHLSDDGRDLITISDRGSVVRGQIVRDPDGQIVDILVAAPNEIDVYPFQTRRSLKDSEGIAVDADGSIYVSFEGHARIGKFADVDAQEQVIPMANDFPTLQANASLEALAIDADGALYTIPERSGRWDKPFPVYRYADRKWTVPYVIPRTGQYLVVGADFGPDGKLYLLERDFSGIGFLTRVRRVDFEAQTAETVLQTGLGVHGNMEGISVWQNPQGETIMTLVADDNFRSFLNNEVAEYRIDG
ncbi:MAG: esterase-like activity of phytase family protein [Pseudomonadota bacterium]